MTSLLACKATIYAVDKTISYSSKSVSELNAKLNNDLHSDPFLENFLGGMLSLRVPTKKGVADDRWAWPIKFAMLYRMKLWRYDKA